MLTVIGRSASLSTVTRAGTAELWFIHGRKVCHVGDKAMNATIPNDMHAEESGEDYCRYCGKQVNISGHVCEQEQIGFWACFYCANTHQIAAECKCVCHKDESPEHTAQNAAWASRLTALLPDGSIPASHKEALVHGINCEKKPHIRTGYLHGEDDDTPYDVDGLKYCGRCHTSL
jgi:hypothetical protein